MLLPAIVYETFTPNLFHYLIIYNYPPVIKHDNWISSMYGWFSQRTKPPWLVRGLFWLLVSNSVNMIKWNPINNHPILFHVIPLISHYIPILSHFYMIFPFFSWPKTQELVDVYSSWAAPCPACQWSDRCGPPRPASRSNASPGDFNGFHSEKHNVLVFKPLRQAWTRKSLNPKKRPWRMLMFDLQRIFDFTQKKDQIWP